MFLKQVGHHFKTTLNMKLILTTTIVGILLLLAATGHAGQMTEVEKIEWLKANVAKARLTIRVLDEAKQPLPSTTVKLYFTTFSNGVPADIRQGLTDASGLFSGEGYLWHKSDLGQSIERPGYYSGVCLTKFTGQTNNPSNRWLPWDATFSTILRPKINPIAMLAKSGWIEMPATNELCGYDLEKGDWVAPHGKGIVADLVFNLARRYISQEDFEVKLEVTFSNPLDGIQEIEMPEEGRNSTFRWPRNALETGYQPKINFNFGHLPDRWIMQSGRESQMFFFRVRTVERDGKIVSALYGKIKGGLELAPFDSKTSKVKLTYYLNPTSLDRNMEFDPQKNLFKNLPGMEQVKEP